MKKIFCSIAALVMLAGNAFAATIPVSDWQTNPLTAGDKTYNWISNSANIDGADVETTLVGPLHSLNLSNLGTVGTNFTLQYSIEIAGSMFFDLIRTSENDLILNNSAGSTIEIFSDAFTTLLFSDTLTLTDTGAIHMFGSNLQKIWVQYTSTGVGPIDRLSNITTDVVQRDAPSVPEPSSLVLCGLAAVGLIFARRRTKV